MRRLGKIAAQAHDARQQTHHPQEAQVKPVQIDEEYDVNRQNCKQVDERKGRENEPQAAPDGMGILRIDGAGPDAQQILHREDGDRDRLEEKECPRRELMNPLNSPHDQGNDIERDQRDQANVEDLTDPVARRRLFDNLVD